MKNIPIHVQENGVVKSRNSVPKYVISGSLGSTWSLKYSMAMVERS